MASAEEPTSGMASFLTAYRYIPIGIASEYIALYQSDLKLISGNLTKKIFNRNLKHLIYSAFQEVKQVVLPLYRLKHQITYSMRDNKIF